MEQTSCLDALKMGYRHIDTAHAYQNERSVGAAVRESGIPREEIWVTSKLWPSEYGEGKTMAGIDKMLDWHVQKGNIIFPKSTNLQHIRDNFNIFDFELTEKEMKQIKALDNGKRFCTATLEEQERNFSAWSSED